MVGFGVSLCYMLNKHARGSTASKELAGSFDKTKHRGEREAGRGGVTQLKSYHGPGQRREGNRHFQIPGPEMA